MFPFRQRNRADSENGLFFFCCVAQRTSRHREHVQVIINSRSGPCSLGHQCSYVPAHGVVFSTTHHGRLVSIFGMPATTSQTPFVHRRVWNVSKLSDSALPRLDALPSPLGLLRPLMKNRPVTKCLCLRWITGMRFPDQGGRSQTFPCDYGLIKYSQLIVNTLPVEALYLRYFRCY